MSLDKAVFELKTSAASTETAPADVACIERNHEPVLLTADSFETADHAMTNTNLDPSFAAPNQDPKSLALLILLSHWPDRSQLERLARAGWGLRLVAQVRRELDTLRRCLEEDLEALERTGDSTPLAAKRSKRGVVATSAV